jgi:hypothetical protein
MKKRGSLALGILFDPRTGFTSNGHLTGALPGELLSAQPDSVGTLFKWMAFETNVAFSGEICGYPGVLLSDGSWKRTLGLSNGLDEAVGAFQGLFTRR